MSLPALDPQRFQKLNLDYSGRPIEDLLAALETSVDGLSEFEATARLAAMGPNEPARKKKRTLVFSLVSKILNPLVIVLLIISGFSYFFGEKISAALVVLMAVASVVLSFVQETRASRQAERLSEMVRATAAVRRGGKTKEIKIREIVVGDIVELAAGDLISADIRIITSKDLFVNQAALTGESIPQEKFAEAEPAKSPMDARNLGFMGSSVVSGSGMALVIKTGLSTQFGEVSKALAGQRASTSFDRGIADFTWLMIRIMLVMATAIFLINFHFKHNLVDSLLFSLAVAVGLTPEMLPMLVALNLSKGAITMSRKQVIVKQLSSIQNFGAMDILCTDKTGTLTKDTVILERHCDVLRNEDDGVLRFAYINSLHQTGLRNLLDRAILKHEKLKVKQYKKIDEIPFDFSRRVMSVCVESDEKRFMITKGAPEEVFKRCTRYELDGELLDLDMLVVADLKEEYDKLSSEGYRVLAIAYKETPEGKTTYSKDDERDLILKGYLAFLDPPKPSTRRAIEVLHRRGVEVKVLTGDNELVTKKICGDVGLNIKGLLTGAEVEGMSDEKLAVLVEATTVFARLAPLQKERIIKILRKNGHVVGYLGDGINDAPSLKAADVGISVANAVDVAKESADIILLRKSLLVLEAGVIEGRRTFANIIKYLRMGASSNFGNMLSMTGASLFLPFLPMLPIQILLNNFLYDISQVGIPTDNVEPAYLFRPKRWDVGAIKRFMFVFGPVSSVFDFLTFGILYFVYKANPDIFRTGWFLESLLTQTFVIHVIRSSRMPFFESVPSRTLLLMSVIIGSAALILPFTPLGTYFAFVNPPGSLVVITIFLVGGYLTAVQIVKRWFVKKYGYD